LRGDVRPAAPFDAASKTAKEGEPLFLHSARSGTARLARPQRRGALRPVRGEDAAAPAAGLTEALADVVAVTVVLRTLIEEFGGEAASPDLGEVLSHFDIRRPAPADLWLAEVLRGLEQSGALALDPGPGSDMVARVLPHGVTLAYDVPLRPAALPHPIAS
jgi:hypothetical protein